MSPVEFARERLCARLVVALLLVAALAWATATVNKVYAPHVVAQGKGESR